MSNVDSMRGLFNKGRRMFPTGIVCIGCGSVIGTIISPVLADPSLQAACLDCVNKATKSLGHPARTDTDWKRVISKLMGDLD
jgi:hypothetical protein